jgi:hypothetical protein
LVSAVAVAAVDLPVGPDDARRGRDGCAAGDERCDERRREY